DRGRERMHERGPFGIVEPERRSAAPAEMPPAGRRVAPAVLLDARAIDADVRATDDRERLLPRAEIDRITAAAGRLSADRAVAALVRHRRIRIARKAHAAAVAGTFDVHGRPPRRRSHDPRRRLAQQARRLACGVDNACAPAYAARGVLPLRISVLLG